ncbi:homocysteine S-methyltransferase family protein (macronuclear) [Tetrahymena thermophila SB210]|uniref:Homocysteine S-methyltransferase family protein n=1 Tax=Tetrahymena thermophila (strain SB210) TaxID=312017 RepID=W7XI38_TETTS|nr:homocysteine S-methyltransferase family protein [Tetrahymena thermophila SB210]EWS72964.1 homocysteine S-methyltransferase family protein [Tetrahymena thermophila SB210]|eukprot:XP_012654497.1 homocysteine S-methyltransferase family protein [Tetrahymena thermophila SB210]
MPQESCDLVGPFSFFVQALLGFLSFLVLIVKRYKEKPKRQWKIWILDTSKQLASAFVAHLLNLFLSIILSSGNDDVDPCHWYFITVIFDTTVGVFLCYLILHQFEKLLTSTKYEKFKSGNYFNIITPDQAISIQEQHQKAGKNVDKEKLNTNLLRPIIQVNIGIWLMQLLIWNVIVIMSKSVLYFIQMGLQNVLLQIAGFLFQGITNIYLELIIVMAIIPVVMNGLQFWVQDNFLKKHEFSQTDKEFLMVEMFAPEDLDGLVELNQVQNQFRNTQCSFEDNNSQTKKYQQNASYDIENSDAI